MKPMISRNQNPRPVSRWREDLRSAFGSVQELLAALELDSRDLGADEGSMDFPLRVPRSFVRRMKKGDPNDPLLRQVLPTLLEKEPHSPGYSRDPLAELSHRPAAGIVEKYAGRVLMITTGACAVHCRYCFRRHYPYGDDLLGRNEWEKSLDWIRQRKTIREIIFSGGDPLSLEDSKLGTLADRLNAIPHVKTLRIHTRQPIVLPSRVNDSLKEWMSRLRLNIVMVLHVNHPQELEADDVREALRHLREGPGVLLNQSVLLRGVNDDPAILQGLSEALFENGVLPYYVHTLDKVEGAAHFALADDRARAIVDDLRHRLPGYLVPRLVQDIPGQLSKIPL